MQKSTLMIQHHSGDMISYCQVKIDSSTDLDIDRCCPELTVIMALVVNFRVRFKSLEPLLTMFNVIYICSYITKWWTQFVLLVTALQKELNAYKLVPNIRDFIKAGQTAV